MLKVGVDSRDERFEVVRVSTCKVWENTEIVGDRDS